MFCVRITHIEGLAQSRNRGLEKRAGYCKKKVTHPSGIAYAFRLTTM